MSQFAVKLQCSNPECLYPDNQIAQPLCDRCQTPLSHRYLWVVGAAPEPESLIDCRYVVIQPQIWLDSQPALLPKLPKHIPDQALPYLRLHSHRLHLPQIFSLDSEAERPVFLLENAPIDHLGELLPTLREAWAGASALRQLNWLWQMLRLWQPLQAEGVASSLLAPENLHCEGGRLRLRELLSDRLNGQIPTATRTLAMAGVRGSAPAQRAVVRLVQPSFSLDYAGPASLTDLAQLWQIWATEAHPTIQHQVRYLSEALAETPDTVSGIATIEQNLTQLLRAQAALLPLQVQTVGATITGSQRTHNEDTCYPNGSESSLPRVGIICDGIGGHAGGEVASQLALRSLQLQLRTWLAELAMQPEPLPAEIIEQQLTGMVRVVNNLIAAQNDLQRRDRQERMGSTLTMAVQLPQILQTEQGSGNTHELYWVQVGDSRAYWLTASACQPLTVDDDLAGREIRAGRSLARQAAERPDAEALTQAVGTREADQLKIHVQRLVIDEDGILLLCSDGLSDHDLVERFWQPLTRPVLQDRLSLPVALQSWIDLADRENGHDNASVVLMQCRLSQQPHLFAPKAISKSNPALPLASEPQSELTASARALLYDDQPNEQPEQPVSKAAVLPKRSAPSKTGDSWLQALGIAALTFVLGTLAVAVWRELAPQGFHPDLSPPAAAPAEPPAAQ